MELKQNRLWDKRHFKLLDKEIWMRLKTPTQDFEGKVKYEDLGLESLYIRKKEGSLVFAVLTIFTAIGGKLMLQHSNLNETRDIILVTIGSIVIFGILILMWLETRKPLIVINGGKKSFSLLAQSPNEREVKIFIEKLNQNIKKRIIDLRVRPLDNKISFEFKNEMLKLLLEEGIITEEEFDKLISDIKLLKPDSSIGYFSSNE